MDTGALFAIKFEEAIGLRAIQQHLVGKDLAKAGIRGTTVHTF